MADVLDVPLKVAVKEVEFYMRNVRTRMPFKYGAATLTSVPILHLKAAVEVKGHGVFSGVAADILPPKWFDKDPDKDYRRNVEDLVWTARQAAATYTACGPASVFDLWHQAYGEIIAAGDAYGLNRLTAAHGSTLMERAVIDAVGVATGRTYFSLLNDGVLAVDFGRLHPQLEGMQAVQALAARPVTTMLVRHTVGLADPIRVTDIAAADRLEDGLPQALDEYIARQGIRYFKIKVNGDLEADLDRLVQIASLLDQAAGDYHVTLDGNEQYRDMEPFLALLDRLEGDGRLARFYSSVLYIEQPLERSIALDPNLADGIGQVSARKPMLVDESDGDLDVFKEAVGLGYKGVSSKNCKGLFKALANQALARHWGGAEAGYFLSGEDLMNLPVVPLHQDLTHLAALGIGHAERNGHHYVRGLDHLSEDERRACLDDHASLYGPEGLRIKDGSIDLSSLQIPGLGVGAAVDTAAMTPLDRWSFDSLL
jgi:hypothetical protein